MIVDVTKPNVVEQCDVTLPRACLQDPFRVTSKSLSQHLGHEKTPMHTTTTEHQRTLPRSEATSAADVQYYQHTMTASSSSSSSSSDRSDWSSDSQGSSFESDDDNELREEDEQDEETNDNSPHANNPPDIKDIIASDSARRSSAEKRILLRKRGTSGPRGHRKSDEDGSNTGSRLRGPRGRTASISTASSARDHSAYAETLRTTRLSSQRASISIAAGAGAAGGHLSEETRRRHRESKKRMQSADLTQKLLLRAHEQDVIMADMPLWLHASVIPPRWRVQIMEHLRAIHEQTSFCRERVVDAWRFLLPPFDRANLHEFDRRVRQFENSVVSLDAAIQQCEEHVVDGERQSACVFLQVWYRSCLAKRGFYTKTITMSRQYRGLIPGMFDTIPGTSRLTVHKRTQDAKLEYPTSAANADHSFR